MTAREIDEAGKRLHELKEQMLEDAVLAAGAFGLAFAATQYRAALAMPLTVGAMAMLFLGTRAYIRRFLLIDELADDQDAYCLSAVRAFGVRSASIEHRREIARWVRSALAGSTGTVGERLAAAKSELEQLVAALEDESVRWEPQLVVAVDHWVSDPDGSFRDVSVPAIELQARVRTLLAGLEVPPR